MTVVRDVPDHSVVIDQAASTGGRPVAAAGACGLQVVQRLCLAI
jgi:hypothetical protein